MTALESLPITMPRLGGAWISAPALSEVLKSVRAVVSGNADNQFGRVILESGDRLVIQACDGVHRVKVWDQRIQNEMTFSCMVPHRLLADVAKNIDGDVWRVQYIDRMLDYDADDPHCLELRDHSGVFKLRASRANPANWASPLPCGIETQRMFSHRYGAYGRAVTRSNKPERTARVLADLARLDDKATPLKMETLSGSTRYVGGCYELEVLKVS